MESDFWAIIRGSVFGYSPGLEAGVTVCGQKVS